MAPSVGIQVRTNEKSATSFKASHPAILFLLVPFGEHYFPTSTQGELCIISLESQDVKKKKKRFNSKVAGIYTRIP